MALFYEKSKFKDRPLLIFDDFVGSGNYASEVLDELVSTGIPATNVVICSLLSPNLDYNNFHQKIVTLNILRSHKAL